MIATRFRYFTNEELQELWNSIGKELDNDRVTITLGTPLADSLLDEIEEEQSHRSLGIDKARDVNTCYFGCWRRVGHSFYLPGMNSSRDAEKMIPWSKEYDGGLCPGKWRGQIQGEAIVTQKEGWTALGFWDRSVDDRGGSHSTFFFNAELDFYQILELSKIIYPEVFKRFDFEIVQVL